MQPKRKNNIVPSIIMALVIYAIGLQAGLTLTGLTFSDVKTAFIGDFAGYFLLYTILYIMCAVYNLVDKERMHHDMHNKEAGSAEWMTDFDKYNKTYSDPPNKKEFSGPQNMILAKDIMLNMDTRQTLRNNNVLLIGGSGAGKSRFFAKPNLLQQNCSFIVTDPSGELLESTGKFLEDAGYSVKVFNLVQKKYSNHYNPFNYIRDEAGIATMVNCLIKNTNEGKSGGDPFWEKSEVLLLQAISYYLYYCCPPEDRNFTNVMKMIRMAEVKEEQEDYESELDKIFNLLAEENKEYYVSRGEPVQPHIACTQYAIFKQGAGKTLKSILISIGVRLSKFELSDIKNLTTTDDIDLLSIGDQKTALFVVVPSADTTFNFLVSLMYSQLFESLYYHAENDTFALMNKKGKPLAFASSETEAQELIESAATAYPVLSSQGYVICTKSSGQASRKGIQKHRKLSEKHFEIEVDALTYIEELKKAKVKNTKKRLLHHTRFILDEFANIGQIKDFEKALATMRKYEISCTIILQSLAQIKSLYKDDWSTIVGNCDSFVYLGGNDEETWKTVSTRLGKATIRTKSSGRTMGGKGGASANFQMTGRDLLSPDEISKMANSDCIVFVRGLLPIYAKKYDYTKHKNYKYTGDYSDEYLYLYRDNFEKRDKAYEAMKKKISEDRASFEKIEFETSIKTFDAGNCVKQVLFDERTEIIKAWLEKETAKREEEQRRKEHLREVITVEMARRESLKGKEVLKPVPTEEVADEIQQDPNLGIKFDMTLKEATTDKHNDYRE